MSPQEISAKVLEKLKSAAEDYLGEKVTKQLLLFQLTLTMLKDKQQKMLVELQDLMLKESSMSQLLRLLLTD